MSSPAAPAPLPAPIAERFRLDRHLRSGGMGQVWLAHDLEWDAPVVLKVPHLSTERAAAELRREFRCFALLDHPNVARFYDLVGDSRACAYSMEHVDGEELLAHLRGGLGYGEPADASTWARLLPAVAQLVAGVTAVHEAGLIHRDLKPANVLMDRGGRLVIVDPGIAARLEGDGTAERAVSAGTLDYMAPEQVLGEPEGTATDWYSVGAMIFEVLAGRPVFVDSFTAILDHWQRRLPVDLAPLPASVGPAWREMLAALLHPHPEARAAGVTALRALVSGQAGAARAGAPFVGRDAELARLDAAWNAGPGRRVVVVSGEPGVGKSRLVQVWTAALRVRCRARVLRGSCDPRESVPFRGLDAVLALRPPPEPTFGRRRQPAPTAVTAEALAQVFADVRERLLEAAAADPVVVVVDSAHWAAPDTRALLAALTAPPLPERLLILVTTRPATEPAVPAAAVLDTLEVGELAPAAAAELLTSRMGPAEAARLAARAGGRPLLLDELARAAAESGTHDAHPDLDALIDSRLQRLPADERLVFALVALAGGPVGSAALRVVGVPHALGAVTGLLGARLLRLEPGPRHVGVVPAHLQFGERCAAQLAPEARRQLHGALAEAFVASEDPRLDLVATHLELSGQPALAATVALRAAAAAREAFAYRAAADAYERAFRLDPALATPERLTALAEVLAALGLGARAAERFLAAAGGPEGDTALVLRAAEQLLKSAKAEAGYTLLTRVLRDRGFSPPTGRWGLLAGIAWNHVRLALGLHPRPAEDLTAEALLVAAAGLSPIDALASHWFGTHYVLGAGEGAPAFRRTHAAALEAILLARFGGAWLGRRSTRRLEEAFARAEADADPAAMAYAWVAAGSLYWTRQEVRRTLEACENALTIYETITHRSVHWERSVARLWHFGALSLAGDTAGVLRLADAVAHDAELREDAWALNSGLFGAVSRAAVIRGDYAKAEAEIQAMVHRSEGNRGYVGAVLVDEAQADVALAQGEIAGAWAALARGRPTRERHGVEVIPALAVSYYSRRAALAAAVAAGRGGLPEAERAAARRIARHDLRALRACNAVNAPEIATVLEAHAAILTGAPRASWEARLQAAEAASEANGHGHWAAAARAVRRAADGVRDPEWCGGRYVDLFLPGLVPPAPDGVAFRG